ncbi:MAG: PEP-CTERM sorting domain-containing protein [Verrucomicrobia bacterium]|nr:MAG: PEP-CTERM sorting domain-containing protein [Verrucomicrobiota bacterium]TAE87803.1 MAG: PEP-CTERM sorting domain-containing protein [Verrucomicrobiota bacterium]TAF25546.1 MAG: PEP-CTERM sorting domain-containing protein [Verrucomicrobiota bacterium]TAF41387.1 MAG: PEP-CTERM sorting domain-containing protein [Verrucomicrobiota bacterium]
MNARRFFRVFFHLAACCSPLSAATYSESIDGELSNDFIEPTPVAMDLGSNLLTGGLAGGENDVDLFRFSVPVGHHLAAIRILGFTGGGGGSFLGIQSGVELSASPVPSSGFPDPIGYAIISASDAAVDRDVLPTIASGPPFQGVAALSAGNYVGWLNETGLASTYQIEFVIAAVPEPTAWSAISLALFASLARRRR